MAITDSNEMVMPVAPMYGGGFGGGMGNTFGGDWGWIILLLLIAGGGWGNGFGGGMGGNGDFPWLLASNNNTDNLVSAGFQNAAVTGALSGIQSSITSGFGDVQNSLCSGFAGVNAGIANGFAQAEISNNARQMANMQQMFGLQSQFADCCCENRLASADLKYTIATENCADRTALNEGVRDILTNQNAGIQRILDQMCNDKIDAKNEKIADLERQLTMANLAASQGNQTATIQAGQRALASEIENTLNPVPIPAYVVPNPACCNSGYGCGCGVA